jgi:hypothetical protein
MTSGLFLTAIIAIVVYMSKTMWYGCAWRRVIPGAVARV